MATLLEQSIEYQKQEIAQLEAQQAQLEQASSQLFNRYRDARSALNAAKANPATPPATLNQLQQAFDNVAAERETANDNLESTSARLDRLRQALSNNEAKLSDPANNTSLATSGNTTSDPGTNPQINAQTTAQEEASTGAIPPNQEATPTPPPVPTQDPAITSTTAGTVENSTPVELDLETGEVTDQPFISNSEEIELDLEEPTEEQIQNEDNPTADPYDRDSDAGVLTEEEIQEQDNPGYTAEGSSRGLQGAKNNAQSQATAQDVANFKQREDWRVRLALAPNATYLYKDTSNTLLKPLRDTDGIIFPYTPSINVQYNATYDQSVLTHSNYKIFQYTGSSVDSVTIGCDFTAQDTFEANYLMAVIHFLRSVTKMFYGQDQDPKPGVPPPLCYLTGLGAFQFDAHPLAITSFNYQLPTDVDYIRAGVINSGAGVNRSSASTPNNAQVTSTNRLGTQLQPGGVGRAAVFQSEPAGTTDPTYVPTKMNIQITAIPIVSRNDISNNFSLKKYATGELLRGTRRKAGGIW